MEVIEPSEFDLVVIGTGFIESIVAAAAAKAGKSVLQIDPSSSYGSEWASLRLDEFLSLAEPPSSTVADGSGNVPTSSTQQQLDQHCITRPHILNQPSSSTDNSLLGPPSQYNIDLAPKVLYGGGPLIALLLGSSAHHYLEFKLIQGNWLYTNGRFVPVPSSRPEIFRDPNLGPLQKRTLMKFLKGCTEALEGQGHLADAFDDRPFVQLLDQERLDASLQDFILYGVLKQDNTTSEAESCLTARQALALLKVYGESVGRYGVDTGPFLTPMYGCGELPQAFCRVAAVAGAIQLLRCPVEALVFDEHTLKCSGVELRLTGQVIRCHAVAANAPASREWLSLFKPPQQAKHETYRCIAVLDRQLIAGESQSVFVIPPTTTTASNMMNAVHGLVLTNSTAVCPADKCILYLWTQSSSSSGYSESGGHDDEDNGYKALYPVLENLVDVSLLDSSRQNKEKEPEENGVEDSSNGASKPKALFAAFYSHFRTSLEVANSSTASWPENFVLCPGPGSGPTFFPDVATAKCIFSQLYPEVIESFHGDFPLDPEAKSTTTSDTPGNTSAGAAATRTSDPNAPTGGGYDDSDDEALAVLRAALGSLEMNTDMTTSTDGDTIYNNRT